jgi:hypothetical protein
MSFGEIFYRISQTSKKKIDKYLLFGAFSDLIPANNIHESKNHRFSNPDIFRELSEPFSNKLPSIVNEIDSVMNHNFNIFGIECNFGSQIDFHLDPKTARSWPLKFWGDIDYRDGQTIGGIKFAWELNRLHHMPKLAIAYHLTGDEKYSTEIFDELEHWIESNPYPFGINWISGLEAGIRIVNLFYTLRLLGTDGVAADKIKLLMNFIAAHGRHLYRYPSQYSSCANHAIGEALGLFIAGLAMPMLKDSHKWKHRGKQVLEKEVTRQIYSDGSSFEHSVPYLQFVADHFLVYLLTAKEFGLSVADEIASRLRAICNFLICLIDINGNVPLIGDDDDGYLLKLWFGKHNNYLSILTTCSILFDEPRWVHPAAYLDDKTLLLLGNTRCSRWERLRARQSWSRQSMYLENAGLAIITDFQDGKEILFVGNSGPLGLEPLGGHGHADALSFWLSVNGQPVFMDPGTYLYHSGGKWRRFFRSTSAHNTVEIDRLDQAEQSADFMFDRFYRIHNTQWEQSDERLFWAAEHDGYCRLLDPVIHRREVTYLKKKFSFRIVDKLKCRTNHNVKLQFHLHPDTRIEHQEGNIFLLSINNTSLVLKGDDQLESDNFYGSENPISGWYSSSFNSLEKSHSLVFQKEINGNTNFETEIRIL